MTIEEMAAINHAWITPDTPQYAVIQRYPMLVLMLPTLTDVQGQLLGVNKADPKRDQQLSDQAADADQEHDSWVTVIVGVLDAVIPVADASLGLQEIRDWLFPRGAMHARDSYQTEIGHALKIESELDAPKKKVLRSITFAGQSLLMWVTSWIDAAKQLQAVEAERAQGAPTGPNPLDARRAFLAGVKGLEAAAKVSKLTADEMTTLFGQLNETEKARPNRPKKVEPSPDPVPTPTPTPSPAPAPTIVHVDAPAAEATHTPAPALSAVIRTSEPHHHWED
jgi:hypothetical protein